MRQTKGLQRNTIDKYYTTSRAVEYCLGLFRQSISVAENDIIIEPSAGNGAFIDGIKSISSNYRFYDIEPEHVEIIKQDYLQISKESFRSTDSKIHLIGNPPFGRQSSLAIQFIKKSAEFCDTIAFILPKSFKKESLRKTFPPYFHLVLETDLPEKSFLVDGEEYDVPCIFQIWEKRARAREVAEKQEPAHFQFVKKTESPDISFRRVGVYAGKIDTCISDKSEQSHYFIQFTNGKTVEENMGLLATVQYADLNNTVGPRSISKQELIKEWNQIL